MKPYILFIENKVTRMRDLSIRAVLRSTAVLSTQYSVLVRTGTQYRYEYCINGTYLNIKYRIVALHRIASTQI